METQAYVQSAIRSGEWITSVVTTEAYLHVPMSNSSQRYLRFRVGRALALPFFGLLWYMAPLIMQWFCWLLRLVSFIHDLHYEYDSCPSANYHTKDITGVSGENESPVSKLSY